MLVHRLLKPLTSLTVFAVGFALGTLIRISPGRAANDDNGAQDEKDMIQIGFTNAVSSGIDLDMAGKDPNMVGLGSYLVTSPEIATVAPLTQTAARSDAATVPTGSELLLTNRTRAFLRPCLRLRQTRTRSIALW